MGKYKQIEEEFTVETGLDTSEIESLRDEMQEWVDNMGGTALENTGKYQMAEEAVNTLDRVDEINFDDIWNMVNEVEALSEETLKVLEYKVTIFKVRSRRQYPSRAYRLSNSISIINGALEVLSSFLEEYSDEEVGEVKKAIEGIESQVQDLDDVEFPGMYG